MTARKSKKTAGTQNGFVTVMTAQDFEGKIERRPVDKTAFAVWVRQLLQNWRQGTVGCKGRSEVSYSNKKPWKQKGTGRARAGSARSPLWRGGGITFGPQPRTRKLKVSSSLKQGVLNNLFWRYLEDGKIQCIDWSLQEQTPKTTLAFKALRDANVVDAKINILLPTHDVIHQASFANIKNVQVLFFDEVNAYDLAAGERWILLKKDIDAFKEMVAQWV